MAACEAWLFGVPLCVSTKPLVLGNPSSVSYSSLQRPRKPVFAPHTVWRSLWLPTVACWGYAQGGWESPGGVRGRPRAAYPGCRGRLMAMGPARDSEGGHVMRRSVNWFVMLSLPVVAAGSGKPTEAASPVERSSQTVITNSIGMRLVLIPAGEFTMGSPGSDKDVPIDEKPQHRVRITRPFFLGANDSTLGQFRQFVKETGRKTEDIPTKGGLVSWNNPGWQQTDEHPAVWDNG